MKGYASLIGLLKLLAAPTDRGVGTTSIRLLKSPKHKPEVKDKLTSLLRIQDCKLRIAVLILDTEYPNKQFHKSTNYFSSPGDSLHYYLLKFGINVSNTCNCSTWLDIMNAWGISLCRQKTHHILMWLRQEAENRNLEFNPTLARQLIEKSLRDCEKWT